jgi:hypothetical protein
VKEQVQAFINQLASLVGVQGAFIFDQQGTIQEHSTPMKVSQDMGVALARSLSRTLTGLSTVQSSMGLDIDFAFGEGRLVVRGIDQGGFCIICDRQLNYSLLNITLEQGLRLLRGIDLRILGDEDARITDALKAIAVEMLGDHAKKVIPILESAGSDRDDLENAIQQAEKMTRMFIDKEQAGKMAERMRELLG